MSRIVDSKQAFLKGAVYEDGGGRPLPRAERQPAPTTEDRLVAILTEIRAAVQLNASLIAKLKTGEAVNYGEQIARQQDVMLKILDEIKRAANVKPEDKPPGKWHFKIIKDEKGMTDVIATEET